MCLAVIGLALSWFVAAEGVDKIIDFSIPPAAADHALDLFAQQADIPLLYPFDVARSVNVKGLSGRYSVEEGIRLLLGGTCLSAEVNGARRTPEANNDNKGITIVKDNGCKNIAIKSLTAAILAALGIGEGYAQETPKTAIEEVLVSARRQQENLQATPVAVTAITESVLKAKQVDSIESTQYSTPNLNISTNSPNSSGFAFLSMRGQSNLGGSASNDPAIGVYVDGVYIARAGGALLDLIDTRQVEVLRGPQGTLFGRNTTGGALNIMSNTPEHALKGSIDVTAGNYALRQATGMINVPLMEDQLAARLVYRDSQRDGYGENVYRGGDLNDDDRSFYRFSLKYDPKDSNWDLLLTTDRTHTKNSGQLLVLTGFNSAGAAAGFVNARPPAGDTLNDYVHSETGGGYRNYSGEDESSELTAKGVSATLNIDFGAVQLKSISGWRALESSGFNDLDGTPYRILNSGYDNDQSQVSQELQLSGTSGALRWIGGLFYFQEEGDELTQSQNMFGAAFGYPVSRNDGTATNTSYAGYGQVYYDLTEKLRLSAGLRYTLDERDVVLRNLSDEGAGTCAIAVVDRDDGVSCKQNLSVDYDYTSYLLGLDYKLTDDIFLYAKTSRAYLAGGWNLRNGGVPSFQPEQVKDIELGAKMDWLDSRLRTNVALFHAKQSDVQRTATGFISGNSGATTSYILNAAEATVKGAEFEIVAVPWEGMDVGFTLGLLDASYDKFTDAAGVDRSKEDLAQAPEYNYSVSLTQTIPASYGQWMLHADYAYTDDFVMWQGSTSNPAAQALFARGRELSIVEGHGLVNAKVSLNLSNKLELALWGRNLAGEEYFSRTQSDFLTSFGYAGAYPGNPRTYGAAVTYRFGD